MKSKIHSNSLVFLSILIFSFLLYTPTLAQTPTSTESLILQLQTQIKALQEQVTKLQAEVSLTKTELEAVKTELKFTKALRLGARGDEVKELQEFLKQFPDIYPQGLVSGYFGLLTEAAVRKFQEKQGIESIGVVGPKTLSKLNELITEGAGASGVVPPGLLTAPGIEKKIEIPATTTPSGTVPAISATPAQPISVTGTSTVPAISATPAQPAITATTTTTTIDTTPPVISGVRSPQATLYNTSAGIEWETNEAADSDLEYGLTANYGSPSGLFSTLITSHSIGFSGLTPETTYHYRVKSKDAAGNLATSGDYTFQTLSNAATYPTLSVSSNPSGATVTNINSGYIYCQSTPCSVQVVTQFSISANIKVSKTGYYDWTNLIRLNPKTTTTVNATLLATATSTSFLGDPRSKNLSAISQMLNSLDEILKQLSQLLK